MDEVITILEASVKENNWELLKETYIAKTSSIPASIKQTFLIQSQKDPQKWRIVTHWRSQEDLDKMRATQEVPVAVQIFKAAGATTSLEIWDSIAHCMGPGSL